MEICKQKNSSRKQRIVAAIPMLIVMILIFLFSAKTAVESDGSSLPVAETILKLYQSIFGNLGEEAYNAALRVSNVLVRKAAHITEFGVLAVCTSYYFHVCRLRRRRGIGYAVALSVVYAITDEIHQLFVPGRSGRVTDVLIDSIGCLLGVLFFSFLQYVIKNRKLKRELVRQMSEHQIN